jgi:hypothetical protein
MSLFRYRGATQGAQGYCYGNHGEVADAARGEASLDQFQCLRTMSEPQRIILACGSGFLGTLLASHFAVPGSEIMALMRQLGAGNPMRHTLRSVPKSGASQVREVKPGPRGAR